MLRTTLWAILGLIAFGTTHVLIVAAGDGAAAQDNMPPKGFKVLFNGKDLTGWQGSKEHWTVKNGVLHYDGKAGNLSTKKQYRNFILHVDWKIKKGGDSGIFPRGKGQVQIWDRKEGSGGIWPRNKPLKRADKAPGQWNHFEIKVDKDLISVKLNGVLVVDKFDMKFGRRTKGPIVLQHHGHPLWFKNIYIKELPD